MVTVFCVALGVVLGLLFVWLAPTFLAAAVQSKLVCGILVRSDFGRSSRFTSSRAT